MLLNDPKKSRSAGLVLLSLGLLLVSCGILWQHALAPMLHLSTAVDDFFHGFSIGLGLTFEMVAVVVLMRVNACRTNS